jgi:hypothetical protein
MYLYLFDPAAALLFLTCASVYTLPTREDRSGDTEDSSSLLPYLDFSAAYGSDTRRSGNAGADPNWAEVGEDASDQEVRS